MYAYSYVLGSMMPLFLSRISALHRVYMIVGREAEQEGKDSIKAVMEERRKGGGIGRQWENTVYKMRREQNA